MLIFFNNSARGGIFARTDAPSYIWRVPENDRCISESWCGTLYDNLPKAEMRTGEGAEKSHWSIYSPRQAPVERTTSLRLLTSNLRHDLYPVDICFSQLVILHDFVTNQR
jgi:hypothetical protein